MRRRVDAGLLRGDGMSHEEKVTTSAANIALAWFVVALPAAWGIYNTAIRAANLFTK